MIYVDIEQMLRTQRNAQNIIRYSIRIIGTFPSKIYNVLHSSCRSDSKF